MPLQPPPGAPSGVAPPPMPPSGAQAAPKKWMPRGAKIALILAVSAIVLIILAVVLIAVFFANEITPPADVANNYVKALNKGDYSTAWGYLTTGAQKEDGRLGFQLRNQLLEGNIRDWYFTEVHTVATGDISKVGVSITFNDGSKTNWDMTLTKVGGEWKIDRVISKE
jgi:hypothetical protein